MAAKLFGFYGTSQNQRWRSHDDHDGFSDGEIKIHELYTDSDWIELMGNYRKPAAKSMRKLADVLVFLFLSTIDAYLDHRNYVLV